MVVYGIQHAIDGDATFDILVITCDIPDKYYDLWTKALNFMDVFAVLYDLFAVFEEDNYGTTEGAVFALKV